MRGDRAELIPQNGNPFAQFAALAAELRGSRRALSRAQRGRWAAIQLGALEIPPGSLSR